MIAVTADALDISLITSVRHGHYLQASADTDWTKAFLAGMYHNNTEVASERKTLGMLQEALRQRLDGNVMTIPS